MTTSIAIVGAGFSGGLLAVHLAAAAPEGARIVLFERGGEPGRGLAYGTSDPGHLLNVRTSNMSAFPDRPGHFLDWLRARDGDAAWGPDDYVPRRLYGTYLTELLAGAVAGRLGPASVEVVPSGVIRLEEHGDGVVLADAFGRRRRFDRAALALGNRPPSGVGGACRTNPWAPDALDGLDTEASVLLVGTGLTAVDVILSLLARGHRGTIHAVSRRGLLPRPHAAHVRPPAPPVTPDWKPEGLAATLWLLRKEAARLAAEGVPWQATVDSLRPHVQAFWRGFDAAERARFLRHLRPWWDVHRHRMPPRAAETIDEARGRGQLVVTAGRILGVDERTANRVEVMVQGRGRGRGDTLNVGRVVFCTGAVDDPRRSADPLIRGLLADGLARADVHGLGLEVAEDLALLRADGRPSARVFALGPLTRPRFWEITSVPHIREHCPMLAGRLTLPTIAPAARGAPGTRRATPPA